MSIVFKKKSKPTETWSLVKGENGELKRFRHKHYGPLPVDDRGLATKKTKPAVPMIPLSQQGRLRIAHLLVIFQVSRTTLHVGVKQGRYPKPDGKDGRMPYWNTETVRMWLEG